MSPAAAAALGFIAGFVFAFVLALLATYATRQSGRHRSTREIVYVEPDPTISDHDSNFVVVFDHDRDM